MLKEKQIQKRAEQVLRALVMKYIESGEPVSSGDIARDKNIDLSPATIRMTMAQLDRADLTLQPHASSGRIPTDPGYRNYLESLKEPGTSRTFAGAMLIC